jgi:hypothetical protein
MGILTIVGEIYVLQGVYFICFGVLNFIDTTKSALSK